MHRTSHALLERGAQRCLIVAQRCLNVARRCRYGGGVARVFQSKGAKMAEDATEQRGDAPAQAKVRATLKPVS